MCGCAHASASWPLPMTMTPIQSAFSMSGEWSQKGDTSPGDRLLLVDATDELVSGAVIPENVSGK